MSPTRSPPSGLAGGSARLGRRGAAVALLVVIGCGGEVAPTEPETPVDVPIVGRQFAFVVSNHSGRPAQLVVGHMGDLRGPVGVTFPAVVGPRTRQEVVFTVPNTNDWAIWVNPGDPRGGEVMGWHEMRRCFGRVALGIEINVVGDVSWTARDPCAET